MRLLNVKTLEFKTFFDQDRPPYGILSHRWTGDETTFQEFELSKHCPDDQCSSGVRKVKRFCQLLVATSGYEWAWVDTCCIDKSSSAELTEAINSMWRWYKNSGKCYVLLDDVVAVPEDLVPPDGMTTPRDQDVSTAKDSPRKTKRILKSDLAASQWFTRGWTLQELLAPEHLDFYDANWMWLAEKSQISFEISQITGIDATYIINMRDLRDACIAERMSWIARRTTSRIEDMAYCLLGLFGIYMPLIYGEGWHAFYRLQQEILANSNDESIFCWVGEGVKVAEHFNGSMQSCWTLLAPRPQCFGWLTNLQVEQRHFQVRGPCRMTNRGLEIQASNKVSQQIFKFASSQLTAVCCPNPDQVTSKLQIIQEVCPSPRGWQGFALLPLNIRLGKFGQACLLLKGCADGEGYRRVLRPRMYLLNTEASSWAREAGLQDACNIYIR